VADTLPAQYQPSVTNMDKNAVKTVLCERLALANIPYQRQGNQVLTANASLMFQSQALILRKPGKAERALPYHKVRISQLLLNLQEAGPSA
jgi:hypothetical protein